MEDMYVWANIFILCEVIQCDKGVRGKIELPTGGCSHGTSGYPTIIESLLAQLMYKIVINC